MKFAFAGYDFFVACLNDMVQAGHELVRVYTIPCDNERYDFNTRVSSTAAAQGVPVSEDPIRDEDIFELIKLQCDVLIVAGYAHKVPTSPTLKIVNVHPSLLPEGRGRWPLPWHILKESEVGGVSIHKLTGKWDAGDVLVQSSFQIAADENLETLSFKVQRAAQEALAQLVSSLNSLWQSAVPQLGGSYWPMPSERERTLDWTSSVSLIDRTVRAFGKFSSFACFDNCEWIVQDATCWREKHGYEPGTVVHRMNREVVIAALDGFVCLRQYEIDPDFKKVDD